MSEKLKAVLDSMPKGGLETDLTDLDTLTLHLTEIAHAVSVEDDEVTACMGRALKHTIPAWASFIRAEQERDMPQGPGTAVFSMTRAWAMLMSIMVLGCVNQRTKAEQLIKPITELFGHDLGILINQAEQVEKDAPTTRH